MRVTLADILKPNSLAVLTALKIKLQTPKPLINLYGSRVSVRVATK